MKSDKRYGIAVLGCGTVGGGTAKILVEDNKFLRERTNIPLFLKYIVDVKFDHAKAIGLRIFTRRTMIKFLRILRWELLLS